MLLRKSRRFLVCLLAVSAVAAVPSRSRADISIQIQEVDSTGAAVGAAQSFATAPGGVFLPVTTANPTSSFLITSISSTVLNSSSSASAQSYLSTTLNLGLEPGYTAGDALMISVQATNVTNPFPGGTAAILEQPSANDASLPGTVTVTTSSTVDGVSSGNALATATQTGNLGGSSSSPTINNLPGTFSIYQTILVSVQPNGTITGNPFGVGDQSTVTITPAAAVPAPGGLVLCLFGLPLLGLRRAAAAKSAP